MSRRTVMVLMWVVAIALVLSIWWLRRAEPLPAGPGPTPGVPIAVFTPEDHAEAADRSSLPVAPDLHEETTTFGGGRRHTHQSALSGVESPSLAWRVGTRGRTTAQAIFGPDGTAYVGSHDGVFRAIAPSGNVRWERNLGGPIYSTAHLNRAGHLFVGSDGGLLFSFTSGGEERFRLNVEQDADTGISESPEGHLCFGAGLDLWCIEDDGTVLWRFSAEGKIFTAPAIDDDGTIYVGSQDDSLYAIAPEGRLRWRYRTHGDNDGSPAIGPDGTIFFGSDDGRVYALDRNGALRWSRDLGGMVRAPIAVAQGGDVLASVFGPHPSLSRLDGETGEVRWTFQVSARPLSVDVGVASAALIDREGMIYFGAYDDYLYSLTPEGALRWAFETGADVDASPAIAEGILVVGSDDRKIYGLRQSR